MRLLEGWRMNESGDKPAAIHFVLCCADCTICFGRISGAAGSTCDSGVRYKLVDDAYF